MLASIQIANPPRQSLCERLPRAIFSFVSEATNIVGLAFSTFNTTSWVPPVVSFLGFGAARYNDYLEDSEEHDYINQAKAVATTNEGLITANHGIVVTIAPDPTSLMDTLGLRDDCCITPAGKCSPAMRVSSWLCQGVSTTLSLMLSVGPEFGLRVFPGAQWLVVTARGAAILIAWAEKHLSQRNQEITKTKVNYRLGASGTLFFAPVAVPPPAAPVFLANFARQACTIM